MQDFIKTLCSEPDADIEFKGVVLGYAFLKAKSGLRDEMYYNLLKILTINQRSYIHHSDVYS